MSDELEKEKGTRYRKNPILGIVIILITGIVNVYGYFHLPAKMATQFTIGGLSGNRIPTPNYLLVTFIFVLLISFLYLREEENIQKIK